jgi:hypothetical protein
VNSLPQPPSEAPADRQPQAEVFLYATGLQRIVREAVSKHPGLDAARITKALVNPSVGRHDDVFFQVSVACAFRLNRLQGRIRTATIFYGEDSSARRKRIIRELADRAGQRP